MKPSIRFFAFVCISLAAAGRATDAFSCTSITVGRSASTDGSVMTSHTCDSHRTGSAVHKVAAARHEVGAEITLAKRTEDDTGPMERYGREVTGTLPQVERTHGYLNPAYASMNEHQLAISESTFGGHEELSSDACDEATDAYWRLGDQLWTKYDEKW